MCLRKYSPAPEILLLLRGWHLLCLRNFFPSMKMLLLLRGWHLMCLRNFFPSRNTSLSPRMALYVLEDLLTFWGNTSSPRMAPDVPEELLPFWWNTSLSPRMALYVLEDLLTFWGNTSSPRMAPDVLEHHIFLQTFASFSYVDCSNLIQAIREKCDDYTSVFEQHIFLQTFASCSYVVCSSLIQAIREKCDDYTFVLEQHIFLQSLTSFSLRGLFQPNIGHQSKMRWLLFCVWATYISSDFASFSYVDCFNCLQIWEIKYCSASSRFAPAQCLHRGFKLGFKFGWVDSFLRPLSGSFVGNSGEWTSFSSVPFWLVL